MPVVKRILYDPTTYHNVEVFREASALQAPMSESSGTYSSVSDIDMSKTIGVMTQLSTLSVYALEMFHNLALLSEDIHDRIKILSMRANTVLSKLPAVEKKATSLDHEHDFVLVKNRDKYLKNRDMLTPPLFIKKTNYCSITNQYRLCTPLPQLWRIEMFIKNDEDCFKLYSFPGFFFQEWLRSEIILQEKRRVERKAEKVKRKKLKKERHKQREEEREELYLRSLERAARVAELEQEEQQLDIDDDAEVNNKVRVLPDGSGNKLGKKRRHHPQDLSLVMPRGSVVQVGTTSPGGNRRGSVDIDEEAAGGSQNESVDEESAAAAEKKKKTKMTKIAKKLGNVFGFSKKPAAKKGEQEDEGSDSENTGGNAPHRGRQTPGSPEAPTSGSGAAAAGGAGGGRDNAAPMPVLKPNAFSKLFMSFNAKDDLDELDLPAETSTPTPTGTGANGNGGTTKRPSQTMDSVALSLLTGSKDKNALSSSGGRNKNAALTSEEEAGGGHARRRSQDNGTGTSAAAAAAALKFSSNNAMMDMDEGAADMFVFASTVFPSRSSRRVPKPKSSKRPSQTREDTSERQSETSDNNSVSRNNSQYGGRDKKRSSVASIQADARKKNSKAKTRFSDSVENGSADGRRSSDPDEERSLSPVEEEEASVEEDAKDEDEEDRPPSEDDEGEEQEEEEDGDEEEQEEEDEEDAEREEQEENEDEREGSERGSEEPVDIDEEEEEQEGGGSPRSRSLHSGESEDDASKASSSLASRHKHTSQHHNHHHHHNQQPPQFHNQLPPARRASVRRESMSGGRPGAPVPPPPPPPTLLLKKAAPPPPPPPPKKEEPIPVEVAIRKNLFDSIKSGNALSVFNSNKTHVAAAASKTIDEQLEEQKKVKVSTAKQNEYVAAILANRSKIAGSDSESSDSDSDYTDDDYG